VNAWSWWSIACALPALCTACACSSDGDLARLPPQNGLPSSPVPLSAGGASADNGETINAGGLAALHRAVAETCPNDHPDDFCFDDSRCHSGGPCLCGGEFDLVGWNVCLRGNCRTDADCGEGLHCSPTLGPCLTVTGYYCHTAQDACADDAGCEHGPCRYGNELQHWACDLPQYICDY
jgi:hypothetical protein